MNELAAAREGRGGDHRAPSASRISREKTRGGRRGFNRRDGIEARLRARRVDALHAAELAHVVEHHELAMSTAADKAEKALWDQRVDLETAHATVVDEWRKRHEDDVARLVAERWKQLGDLKEKLKSEHVAELARARREWESRERRNCSRTLTPAVTPRLNWPMKRRRSSRRPIGRAHDRGPSPQAGLYRSRGGGERDAHGARRLSRSRSDARLRVGTRECTGGARSGDDEALVGGVLRASERFASRCRADELRGARGAVPRRAKAARRTSRESRAWNARLREGERGDRVGGALGTDEARAAEPRGDVHAGCVRQRRGDVESGRGGGDGLDVGG